MKKKNFFIGASALLLMAGMNFSHALNEYGFLDGNLCASILAQTTGTGSTSTGGGSSSGNNSSSGSSSTGMNSGSSSNPLLKPDLYDFNTDISEIKLDGVIVIQSKVIRCFEGKFMLDCKNYCINRFLIKEGVWTDWENC